MDTFELVNLPFAQAEAQAREAETSGKHTLVGALVIGPDGRLFAQRRSLTRAFGPGLWDNVGGHLEPGETLRDALAREMREETGWGLQDIRRVIAIRNWTDPRGESMEFICICTATGNLDAPTLEPGKVDHTAWIGEDTLHILTESRPDDVSQLQIYAHALKVAHETSPSR